MFQCLRIILEMIKFEHTVFALPFALIAALAALHGEGGRSLHGWQTVGWILVAMVGARSSAMTVNRIVDIEYDRLNPRTATRALPAGVITRAQAWIFALVTAGMLVLAAAMLNPLALFLSPIALLIIWGYSFTKRFTRYSHLVLGLALGIAPAGAWIALTGTLPFSAMLLSAAVMCWTAGFDIIYACQDVAFDRRVELHSLPARLGMRPSLLVSSVLHAMAFVLFAAFGMHTGMRYGYGLALVLVAALLIVQHRMVRPDDLRRVNAAFFTANGLVSLALLIGATVDLFLL